MSVEHHFQFKEPANILNKLPEAKKSGLQKVASRMSGDCESKNKSKKLLVRECVQYLSQCHPHVLDLPSACILVELIKTLVHHADDDPTLRIGIASICEELLGRQWYDLRGSREKGAELNSQASELLSAYLCHSEDQLAAVTKTRGWLSTETQQLTDKGACLSTIPAFSRSNVHILIGGLLKGLEGAVRQKLEEQQSDKEQLELWCAVTQGLETLVAVVKANESKPNLRAFMKVGASNFQSVGKKKALADVGNTIHQKSAQKKFTPAASFSKKNISSKLSLNSVNIDLDKNQVRKGKQADKTQNLLLHEAVSDMEGLNNMNEEPECFCSENGDDLHEFMFKDIKLTNSLIEDLALVWENPSVVGPCDKYEFEFPVLPLPEIDYEGFDPMEDMIHLEYAPNMPMPAVPCNPPMEEDYPVSGKCYGL